MIGEPIIAVWCDNPHCDYREEFGLTATAQHGYDERNLASDMKREGWVKINGQDVCPECAKRAYSEEEKP